MAHVVRCDASKSKQKEVLLKPGAVLIQRNTKPVLNTMLFGLSCWPLDDGDGAGGGVAYTYRQREQATVRLRVKGPVAHVVWCDVSKSKQKEVLLKSGAVLI